MKNICGLDFGTSNTLSAVQVDGKSKLASLENENYSIPSSVFYEFENVQKPIYGQLATQTYINGGYGRYMKSFKRILGTSFFDEGTLLKPGHIIKFHDILVDYLKNVKNKTEFFIQSEVDHVVVGKPVRLAENELESNLGISQLKSVLEDVGYNSYSFLDEPIAAAFYHRNKMIKNSLALVADLGGGTCDFTVVQKTENSSKKNLNILSTTGISIGGTDIDSEFALNVFYPELGYKTKDKYKGLLLPDRAYRDASDWNRITTSLYTPKVLIRIKKMINLAIEKDKVIRFKKIVETKQAHTILSEIENAKIDLSFKNEVTFQSALLDPEKIYSIRVNNLNETIDYLLNKIVQTACKCVSLSNVGYDKINYLILTGGTSKLPLLQELLSKNFPNAKIIDSNSMDSVSLGLLEKAKLDRDA